MTAVLGVAEPYRPLLCKPPGTVDGTKFRRAELVVADHHTTVGLLPVQILGCGFFYLEVGVGALLPCTGPLVGDALPANPLIGHGRQYALVPSVVVKLLHRQVVNGSPRSSGRDRATLMSFPICSLVMVEILPSGLGGRSKVVKPDELKRLVQ